MTLLSLRISYKVLTSVRSLHLTPIFGNDLSSARSLLWRLKTSPSGSLKLRLYALWQQATLGRVRMDRPSIDMEKVARWDAWYEVRHLSTEEATAEYVSMAEKLATEIGVNPEEDKDERGAFRVEDDGDGVRVITLNKPGRLNAFSMGMVKVMPQILKEAAEDVKTKVVVLTGEGRYYSSGNDLSNLSTITPESIAKVADESRFLLEMLVDAFIDFPKPLIAAVNGPALGIGFTSLALCDAVYASDRAFFSTPFTRLGQSPEGCSSYLFPLIFGRSLANEILLFDRKITASEAKDAGLVSEIIPHMALKDAVKEKASKMARLPQESVRLSKKLTRDRERRTLKEVNREEAELLRERWQSKECFQAVMEFIKRK